MKYEVVFTDTANKDFYAILDYISKDSPTNALNFIDKLQKRIKNTLSNLPFGGTIYKDGVRFFVFDNYIVIYEPIEEKRQVLVYMLTERHRQWHSIFDKYFR